VQDLKADNPQAHEARLDRALSIIPNVRPTLKGDLLALETTATTTATTKSTAATTTATTATSAETATTSTTAATAATETTSTTAAEAATATAAATVVVTRLGIVKTDRAALKVTAVELLESRLRILDGAESNVAKALGTTSLPEYLLA
jgi:hypothetical protein